MKWSAVLRGGMKPIAWVLLCVAGTACGGRVAGDASLGSVDGSRNPSGGRPESGGSSGGIATSGSDSGGGSNPSWDAGLLPPSGPGYVRCGSTTCGPGDQCCLAEQGDPAANGCDSLSLPTCNGTQDVRDCDEQADCHPDEDCCYDVFTSPPATIGSRCGPKGSCDLAIACGSDADCAQTNARQCVAQRCRGDILETCGELPTEDCPP